MKKSFKFAYKTTHQRQIKKSIKQQGNRQKQMFFYGIQNEENNYSVNNNSASLTKV